MTRTHSFKCSSHNDSSTPYTLLLQLQLHDFLPMLYILFFCRNPELAPPHSLSTRNSVSSSDSFKFRKLNLDLREDWFEDLLGSRNLFTQFQLFLYGTALVNLSSHIISKLGQEINSLDFDRTFLRGSKLLLLVGRLYIGACTLP